MRTRKKEKKRNEEKQDLQKVQKRENRETKKIRTKKGENSDETRREEKIKQKMVGQVARNVEHCLWPPTCSSWQFACCGFQRAQLLSQFILIRWTHVLLLSCLFWTRFPGCLFFRTCKCLEVRCVLWEQNCFCLPSSLVAWSFCLHVTRVVSRLNHPAGSIFLCVFLLLRLCVFLSSWIHVPISLLAVSLLVCEALATLVYFSGAVGDTWRSRHCRYVHLRVFRFAPRVALACSVSLPSPCLFLLHRLRWLLLRQGWCSLGRPWWILASLSTSCWNPWHRDGFWLGFCFLPSLLSAGYSFLPPDVVRASSLWHVLRILTLFLALTGTMALHVLKLDGVTSVYGIFFSVAVFSVLVLGRFSDLSQCCLRQSPVWVPRLFCWGMCGTVYRVFGPTLETREFLSAGWLGRSTVACISHALALSYFGMVAVAVSSCYCLRGWRLWWYILCVSGSTLWVLATSLCVFVWRGILSWLLFVWCCGCLAAGHLACRNDVAPASAWKLLFLGSASICDSSQLVLSFRSIGCAKKKTQQKNEKTAIKKERRKKNKQKKMAHTENNEKKKKDNKDVKR